MSKSTEELRQQIREIMREWEGMFPFPDPDDAGEEARIAHEVPTKLMALFDQELAKRVEEARIYKPTGRTIKVEAAIRAIQREQFDGELGEDYSLLEVGEAAIEEFSRLHRE